MKRISIFGPEISAYITTLTGEAIYLHHHEEDEQEPYSSAKVRFESYHKHFKNSPYLQQDGKVTESLNSLYKFVKQEKDKDKNDNALFSTNEISRNVVHTPIAAKLSADKDMKANEIKLQESVKNK